MTFKRKALTMGAVGLMAVTSVGGAALASSHREAPMIAKDPTADITDLYAFVSPDDEDSVTLIGNWWPFADPQGGPNFYKFADDGSVYDINIDSNGDARPDITYRWTFRSTYRTQDTILY
nr:DUF4331 family protein [Chloroflexota bacterium]